MPRVPACVKDASEDEGHRNQDFEVWELVTKRIIGRAEGQLKPHQVDGQGGGWDEEDLHASIVKRDEVHE